MFSLISTVFVFIVSLILGYIYSDFNEFSIVTTDLEYLFAFFVKLLAFFSFGLFLGILVKRSAFAVGAMFVWFIFESFIKGMLFWKIKPHANEIMRIFPLEAMSNLIKEPFTRFSAVQSVAKQVGEDLSKDFSVQPLDILIVLLWTAAFVYFSFLLLKKRDL